MSFILCLVQVGDALGDLVVEVVLFHCHRLLDALADRGGVAAAVTFDDDLLGAQKDAAAVVLVVHELLFLLEHLFHEERAEFVHAARVDVLLDLLEELEGGAFGGLDHDVAREAVRHHDVVFAREQVAAFHVAHEIVPVRGGDQFERLFMQHVAFLGLGADVQHGDARILHAERVLHVQAAHDGELEHLLGGAVNVGAAVAHAHQRTRHSGEHRAERGADQAADTADADGGGGDQRARCPGGHHAGNIVVLPQHLDALHHGALALQADGIGGFVLAGDLVGRVQDLVAGLVGEVQFRQRRADRGFVTREDDVQVGMGEECADTAFDVGEGAVVAAQSIDNKLDHDDTILICC